MLKKSKKVLILGSNESFSLEGMYFRAFKSQNFKVDLYHAYRIRKNIFKKSYGSILEICILF